MPITAGVTSPITIDDPSDVHAKEASNWLNILNMAQFKPQETMLQMSPATNLPGPQGLMESGVSPSNMMGGGAPNTDMLRMAGMGQGPEMPNFRGLSQMYRSA